MIGFSANIDDAALRTASRETVVIANGPIDSGGDVFSGARNFCAALVVRDLDWDNGGLSRYTERVSNDESGNPCLGGGFYSGAQLEGL